MTLDTYSHTIPSLQADAMSRLNTLLTQQETIKNPVAVTVAVKADQQPKTKRRTQAWPRFRGCSRLELNQRTRFRRPVLYPLSYGNVIWSVAGARVLVFPCMTLYPPKTISLFLILLDNTRD